MKQGLSKAILTVLLIALGACAWLGCSSDDDKTDPLLTIPSVRDAWHGDLASMQVQPEFTFLFSEEMNRSSVENATVLTGDRQEIELGHEWIGNLYMVAPRTPLEHGSDYSLTIGDDARAQTGIHMSDPAILSFSTVSANPGILRTYPADGAVAQPVNLVIWLEFNQPMLHQETQAFVGLDPNVGLDFEWSTDEGEILIVTPTQDLAPLTTYTLTVDGGASSWPGNVPMGSSFSFSFDTSGESDDTPPAIVAWDPPSGSTDLTPGFGEISISFSEPVNPVTVIPQAMDARFMMSSMGGEPRWNADFTALTVDLMTLPSGIELFIDLAPFADMAGNLSADPEEWRIETIGTPDWFPSGSADEWIGLIDWSEDEDSRSVDTWFVDRVDNKSNNAFSLTRSIFMLGDLLPRQSNHYSKLSNAIQLRGARTHFYDPDIVLDIDISPAADWMRLPPTTGLSWNGVTNASITGFGSAEFTYEGVVLGFEDVLFEMPGDVFGGKDFLWSGAGRESEPEALVRDCAKVRLEWVGEAVFDADGVERQGLVVAAGLDTLWYAPGVGVLKAVRHSEYRLDLGEMTVTDSEELAFQWYVEP